MVTYGLFMGKKNMEKNFSSIYNSNETVKLRENILRQKCKKSVKLNSQPDLGHIFRIS